MRWGLKLLDLYLMMNHLDLCVNLIRVCFDFLVCDLVTDKSPDSIVNRHIVGFSFILCGFNLSKHSHKCGTCFLPREISRNIIDINFHGFPELFGEYLAHRATFNPVKSFCYSVMILYIIYRDVVIEDLLTLVLYVD